MPASQRLSTLLRLGFVVAWAAALGACASFSGTTPKFSEADYGVEASDRVVSRGRVPAGGGYEHVGSPYVIAGQLYVPRENPNYSEVGYASWYGANFHGRLTANGEIYDMNSLSAAHTTLPLPSYVRVTNLDNGSSVVVRVNDRGPFHGDRIIDLSARAGELLGMTHAGVARVQVDYVGRASLEGNDTRMLMATYQAPGARTNVVAYDAETRSISTRRGLLPLFGNGNGTSVFQPQTAAEDPIAGLLGGVQSFAADPGLTPAQAAADLLAAGGAPAEPDTSIVVQVGVFSDHTNADSIAVELAAFGAATVTELETAAGPMWSVQIVTTAAQRRATINAAERAGASGAYALN